MVETHPAAEPPLVTGGFRIARAAICALVFLAAGSIVYCTAARQTGAPESYRATATILERLPKAAGSNAVDSIPAVDSIRTFRPDPEAIKRQVLTDASLRQIAAPGRSGPPPVSTPADLEPIRRRLRVTSQSAAAGPCVLSIEYTDGRRDQVLRLVNELARRYANAHCAAVDAMVAAADNQAAQAVQQSCTQLEQAEAQRSEFLRRLPPVQPRTETPKTAPAPAKPRWVDNPRWVDLQRGHDDLVRRREELLVKRTPLHPEVLVVNDLIAESEAKMASVPRRLLVGDIDAGTQGPGDAETRGHGDAGTGSPGGHGGIAGQELVQWKKRQLALDAAVQQARASGPGPSGGADEPRGSPGGHGRASACGPLRSGGGGVADPVAFSAGGSGLEPRAGDSRRAVLHRTWHRPARDQRWATTGFAS